MSKDVQDAVSILNRAHRAAVDTVYEEAGMRRWVFRFLTDAIRHLAYPDRDTYPKTRKGTKGAPIVRR